MSELFDSQAIAYLNQINKESRRCLEHLREEQGVEGEPHEFAQMILQDDEVNDEIIKLLTLIVTDEEERHGINKG